MQADVYEGVPNRLLARAAEAAACADAAFLGLSDGYDCDPDARSRGDSWFALYYCLHVVLNLPQ